MNAEAYTLTEDGHLRLPDGLVMDETGTVRRKLDDGRELHLIALLYGRAQIGVTTRDFFDGGYRDSWEFPDIVTGTSVLRHWDGEGEPFGWDRHPGSHRRRRGGDPLTEEVRP